MVETQQVKVYGAWLYKGEWDGAEPPPGADWKLLGMVPGRFQEAPKGMEPTLGQVLLLMQGDNVLVVTP